MGPRRSRDERDRVDEVVLSHQLHYSLMQLRLVGLLMLLFVLARSLLPLLLGHHSPPIQQLASITALSNSLPLLPLGISLYLLGGGRQRLPQEFLPATVLHRALVPLALACLLLLPTFTLQRVIPLNQQRGEAVAKQEALLESHRQWLAQAEQATSADQVQSVARRNAINVPFLPGEPADLSRWRLAQALDREINTLHRQRPILKLSAYELELLSLPRTFATLLLQLITGAGLLLLHRQGSREIQRQGLTTGIFFRIDPVRSRPFAHARN
jgi:hypothetical protein